MQDAKARAQEWRDRGDVEILRPARLELQQPAPAASRSSLRMKVRLAMQRIATDERRVRQL